MVISQKNRISIIGLSALILILLFNLALQLPKITIPYTYYSVLDTTGCVYNGKTWINPSGQMWNGNSWQ